jgi:hypothetical protein
MTSIEFTRGPYADIRMVMEALFEQRYCDFGPDGRKVVVEFVQIEENKRKKRETKMIEECGGKQLIT